MKYNPHIKPGVFELYVGPMNSGKTKAILDRIDKIRFIDSNCYLFVRPLCDTRNTFPLNRHFGKTNFATHVYEKKPEQILEYVGDKKIVAIDELQFFEKGIEDVIEEMQRDGINVIASGLDTNFKGEPFGRMGVLLSKANEIYKQSAICQYDNCGMPATRTQKLINGEPASYNSKIIVIEDGTQKETYEPRCLEHHTTSRGKR
ncbi:hypothetical protein [Oceanihabitans sediminis]|uniref:thymidine kinase n=1 Tax=Oceanihabitans sediminis TaxID=1812012 RepID=UPI00299F34FE|nr:hypothetical protein [Oceanihabitans sediminis]MDX1279387.1 hypothetical protein [Oceanihabitans sediminis]